MDRFEFVKKAIGDLSLDPRRLNSLETMASPVALLRRAFTDRGWTVTADRAETRTKLFLAPDGNTVLRQRDGKVWRHPDTTETICKSKDWSARLMRGNGVPVANGLVFDLDEEPLAGLLWRTVADSVVVKPSNSGGSRGVTVGVDSDERFSAAWEKATAVRASRKKVVVEEILSGVEVRCFVVGDRVVSSILRLPSFVVGDGNSSLRQLIAEAEKARSANVRYAKATVTPDWNFLSQGGLTPNSVPAAGNPVILNEFHLFRLGNYTPEVSDVVAPSLEKIAVAARKSIPSLEIAAVDILVEDIKTGHNARVLEINTAPALSHHLYPAFGESVDIPSKIADYFDGR